MSKRDETIPPYGMKTRAVPEKVTLMEYFEQKVGYSFSKRQLLGCLFSDGFRVEHWPKILKLLNRSDKPIAQLFQKVTKHKLSAHSAGMLWVLIHALKNEIFTVYLNTQIKAHAQEGYLNLKYIGGRFGIDASTSGSFFKESVSYAEASKAIKKALNDYYEIDEDVLKIRKHKKNAVEIKFGADRVSLGFTWAKGSYAPENLISLHNDVIHSKKSILDIIKKHKATNPVTFKLFDVYNHKKILQEMEAILENKIGENILIYHVDDILHTIFGTGATKREKSNTAFVYRDFQNKLAYKILTEKKIFEQKKRSVESNLKMLKRRCRTFKLMTFRGSVYGINSFQIEFINCDLYVEWAEFVIKATDSKKRLEGNLSLSRLFNHITSMKSRPKTFSSKDIQKSDLVAYFDDENTSENEIGVLLLAYRQFIKFLQDREELNRETKMGILPKAPKHDVSKSIARSKKDKENRQPIPDEVHDKIMLYRKELEPTMENAYIFLAELGIRPNELEGITPDSKVEKNGKTNFVIWQFKSKKAHVKNGKKPLRTIPASALAISAFDKQVEISKKIRNISGLDCIYVRKPINRSGYRFVHHSSLMNAINKLIRKYSICDPATGELWHYTPYQLRVKLVVEMIENGADHEQLQAFMGHLGSQALQNAYAMVEKLKLMDMDTEFFEKEFGIKLSKETIDQYSEEDLKEVVVLLLATSRKMMYGTCTRHPIQGDCGKLHEASSCAPCESLKTDPTNRQDWEARYTEQYKTVRNLRKWYAERNVKEEDFKTFEIYVRETWILWSYASVLFHMQHTRSWRVEA